jgi:hypothetical protein
METFSRGDFLCGYILFVRRFSKGSYRFSNELAYRFLIVLRIIITGFVSFGAFYKLIYFLTGLVLQSNRRSGGYYPGLGGHQNGSGPGSGTFLLQEI